MSRKLFKYESKDGTIFTFTFDKKTYNEQNFFTDCRCECRHHGMIEDWESPDFGSILDLIKYYAPIKKIMYTSPEFLELMAIYKEKL